MVVDDDHEHREALTFALETRGEEVQACQSAGQAIEVLQAGPLPDVIILDLMMPHMDGWQFRLVQKRDALWATIPVIAMSGLKSPQAAAVDADAFLEKPIGQQVLRQTIERVVSSRARQNELARAGELERLVSLGALLAGISHEINNPLAIAIAGIDVACTTLTRLERQQHSPAVTAALHALDSARAGAQRVHAVVRTAAVFATADLERIDDIDVRAVLESSLQIVSNELRHAARLVRDLQDVPHVRGNAARLGQVLLNMLLNAITAVRESGEHDHLIRVCLYESGEQVVVSISDTAASIVEPTEGSLTDPLGTAVRAGTRLRFGLTVSAELVHDMGGRIEGERNSPHGATYRVLLPVQRTLRERDVLPPRASEVTPPPTVLIIDDEPLICEMLKAMLAESFEVVAFSSAHQGLAELLQNDYGAIICDMMMPELSGDELFEQAVRVRPALRDRFVFITGGAFAPRAQSFLKQAGRPVLHKPCSRRALLEAIASTLGVGMPGEREQS